jgi:jumonji domain-containing protein 7
MTETLQTPATLNADLEIIPDEEPAHQVPWASLPPPALSHLWPSPLQPMKVTVKEGQTLYLPSGWWHGVEQESGPGGFCIAVN